MTLSGTFPCGSEFPLTAVAFSGGFESVAAATSRSEIRPGMVVATTDVIYVSGDAGTAGGFDLAPVVGVLEDADPDSVPVFGKGVPTGRR